MRRFAGRSWSPSYATLAGPPVWAKPALEAALGCELRRGNVSAIVFPAEMLDLPNPLRPVADPDRPGPSLPAAGDFLACIAELIALDLIEHRPRLSRLCRRLHLSRRSLQRRFHDHDATYEGVLRAVLLHKAFALLEDDERPITTVALELGYTDPAHFTRAFRAWTGQTPRAWRSAR